MICINGWFVCLLCQSESISGMNGPASRDRKRERENYIEATSGTMLLFLLYFSAKSSKTSKTPTTSEKRKQPFQPIETTARPIFTTPYLKNELKVFSGFKKPKLCFRRVLMCVVCCVGVCNLFTCKLFERVNWKIITFFPIHNRNANMGHGYRFQQQQRQFPLKVIYIHIEVAFLCACSKCEIKRM